MTKKLNLWYILTSGLGVYRGYNASVDATIANVFSTAAFRFGHAAIRSKLFRLDEQYLEHPEFGNIKLHQSFFATWRTIRQGGLDPILRQSYKK